MSDIKAPPPETGTPPNLDVKVHPKPPQGEDQEGGPWDAQAKRAFTMKDKSEFFDPCQEAARMSIKCLHRNGGDRSMCGDYFKAYRDCKKEWLDKVREERKKLGRNAVW